ACRCREFQTRLWRRDHPVDRRARDAGHGVPLPALEVRRAPATRRSERVTTIPPPGWDDAAVRSPGGHVLQSSTWARIRESQGWRPEFVRFSDAPLPCALILWSPSSFTSFAYVPRGPIVKDDSQLAASLEDRKSTRLNSSHQIISYAVFCF